MARDNTMYRSTSSILFLQKLNPNVEAKLSYLMKFVQESIEEDEPSAKKTFTMIEVRLWSFKYSVREPDKNCFYWQIY